MVLPLSGDRAQLGERALSGIEVMIDELNLTSEETPNKKYKIEE